jgi:ABC-type sugar transport system ATPase subunit
MHSANLTEHDTYALECRGVTKSFGATRAVSDISFHVRAGEILALVGENGAGKSSLMNLLSGALAPDSGTIRLGPAEAPFVRQVAMVHQELSLFGNLTVAENLELDRADGAPLVGERRSRARAQTVLDELGLDIPVDATVDDLTVGQRQLVEVAKAIAIAPVLLILDEPTSSLEGPQVELLFAAVRTLARQGTAVIFVSHRMDELFTLCDRVLVMRDGSQIEFGALAGHTHSSLVEAMVGRDAGEVFPPRSGASGGEPVLALEDVTVPGRIAGVSLTLRAGRIVALAGLDGHGQSEIAEVCAGALAPASGRVLIDGRPVRLRGPRAAVRRGIGYVSPDRRRTGLLLEKSIAENAMLPSAPRVFRTGFVNAARERRIVRDLVARLAVKSRSVQQAIIELSGGNQQKVIVGRWLIFPGLRVLVLNDPTRGVDVASRAQIYRAIRQIADEGVAVALVSTDLQEILGLGDEIHVVYSGRITGVLEGEEATESAVMHLATGAEHHAS